MNVACQMPGCKRMNAVMVERTNPLNYHVERLILCAPCRTKLGIAPPVAKTSGRSYRVTNKGEM